MMQWEMYAWTSDSLFLLIRMPRSDIYTTFMYLVNFSCKFQLNQLSYNTWLLDITAKSILFLSLIYNKVWNKLMILLLLSEWMCDFISHWVLRLKTHLPHHYTFSQIIEVMLLLPFRKVQVSKTQPAHRENYRVRQGKRTSH